MKKAVFALLAVLCPISGIFAQDIRWLGETYDFGIFNEEKGKQEGELKFINEGKRPTFIKSVVPACGCTDVSYTKEIIQPGDTAVVNFSYNPVGRPGNFDKGIKVFIGDEGDFSQLRIKGEVIPSEQTLSLIFPFKSGVLRHDVRNQSGGEITKGKKRTWYVNVYNQSSDNITPDLISDSESLTCKLTPASLPPRGKGVLTVRLDTSKETNIGPVSYSLRLTDKMDETDTVDFFTVDVTLMEDPLSVETKKYEEGGRAYIVPEFIDLGEDLTEGEVYFEFLVCNEGKENLEVKRIYSAEEAVKIESSRDIIKPGKQMHVKGKLNLSEMETGPFRIPVTVFTDDALHPQRIANIVGIKAETGLQIE